MMAKMIEKNTIWMSMDFGQKTVVCLYHPGLQGARHANEDDIILVLAIILPQIQALVHDFYKGLTLVMFVLP